jgi:hypothetical protein
MPARHVASGVPTSAASRPVISRSMNSRSRVSDQRRAVGGVQVLDERPDEAFTEAVEIAREDRFDGGWQLRGHLDRRGEQALLGAEEVEDHRGIDARFGGDRTHGRAAVAVLAEQRARRVQDPLPALRAGPPPSGATVLRLLRHHRRSLSDFLHRPVEIHRELALPLTSSGDEVRVCG